MHKTEKKESTIYPQIGQVYRHYKSTGGSNHTYEIVGIAKHSETEEELVIYKPLFDAESTWLWNAQFAARPVSMRFEQMNIDGIMRPRFALEEK